MEITCSGCGRTRTIRKEDVLHVKFCDVCARLYSMMNGVTRTFIHPSGGSFAVLVTGFVPEARVDEYDRRIYPLTLKETREW